MKCHSRVKVPKNWNSRCSQRRPNLRKMGIDGESKDAHAGKTTKGNKQKIAHVTLFTRSPSPGAFNFHRVPVKRRFYK